MGRPGGLGVFGVQLVAASGANAIGVISDETKRQYVLDLGAKGGSSLISARGAPGGSRGRSHRPAFAVRASTAAHAPRSSRRSRP